MAHRFCPRCNAEVEDAGGYCLLGHDLRLAAPVDSLKALRAEVDRTFDEARRELAHVMAPAAVLAPELEVEHSSPTLDGADRPAPTVRLDEAVVLEGPDDGREWADELIERSPGETQPVHASANVWDGLDEAPALNPGDPIATFAPAPRMDWGPRRSRFGRRRTADEQRADA